MIPNNAPLSRATRWSLLSGMMRQEEQAWENFNRIYQPLILEYAASRGLQPADAADVCQEVLSEVHRDLPKLDRGPDRGSFTAWLKQKIRWRVEDRRQANSRRVAVSLHGEDSSSNLASRLPDPQAIDAEREFDLKLARQLDAEVLRRLANRRTLRAKLLQAYYWKRRDGWDSARIARALDVASVATVDTWVHRVQRLYDAELARLTAQWT